MNVSLTLHEEPCDWEDLVTDLDRYVGQLTAEWTDRTPGEGVHCGEDRPVPAQHDHEIEALIQRRASVLSGSLAPTAEVSFHQDAPDPFSQEGFELLNELIDVSLAPVRKDQHPVDRLVEADRVRAFSISGSRHLRPLERG